MGILSMKIQKKIHPDSTGYFEIYQGKDYSDFVKNSAKKHSPLVMNGKLQSGFYPLTEVKPNSCFGAYVNLSAD